MFKGVLLNFYREAQEMEKPRREQRREKHEELKQIKIT